MKTIAICSGKGGAGKTVFASALATMLVELGSKVLLVDADYSVGGLTYLTHKTDAVVESLFFENIINNGITELREHITDLRDDNGFRGLTVIPSAMRRASFVTDMSVEQVHGTYCEFVVACEAPPLEFDYVIVDTRAGLDPISAGVALASNIVIVLMEQDRVSFRSSHAFVANVLALSQAQQIINVSQAEDYYYVPNKVSPGYAQALKSSAALGMPGNVLPGIPLDLNFFNRYFTDIFNYQPQQGRFWRRTAFYGHLKNSLSEVIDSLPRVRYSPYLTAIDTLKFNLTSSPQTITLTILVLFYTLTVYLTFVFLDPR